MATDSDVARLRQKYTGEPRAVALEWYRNNGLHQGLVPDATDWVQELLEAGVLQALVRSPLDDGSPVSAGTLCGVVAASPRSHGLTLWCRDADLPLLLARLLPAQTGPDISGVPWLRPWASPEEDLALGLIGRQARITVRVRHATGTGRGARVRVGRAGREDLERAHAWTIAAGGTPLWDESLPQRAEGGPLELLGRRFGAGEAAPWSRALRRAGLFLERMPDWRSRPPAAEELEGPNPVRLQPRAAGPARTTNGDVVAVTSSNGRGGYGCTTAAVVLAGALARSGNRVLVLGGDDPSNVVALFGNQPTPAFTGNGSVNVGLLPPDAEAAREMVSRARQWQYDVVVLDPGFQQRRLVDTSDLVLAVMPDRPRGGGSLWTDTRVVDRRPEHVRMWEWLDERSGAWTPPAPDPVQRLMILLDLMFAVYLAARAEDGDPRVYDPADAEEIEEWWGDLAHIAFDTDYDAAELDDEDYPDGGGDDTASTASVPEGTELDSWRADFISFLHPEGLRRHPDQWPHVASSWPERQRQRQAAGLMPGHKSEDEWWALLKVFFADVEEDAVATWGLALWEEHRSRWATALIRDENLYPPFDDLVESTEIPRQGTDVARDLAGEMRGLPPMPVIGVLTRARRDIDAQQLNDTAAAVTEHGLSGLALLPDLREWSELWGNPAGLATPSPRAAATSLALARAVTEQLPRRAKGERA
ncbi:hypothetical protein ACFXKF_36335 [Streptomyces scopuliridis]|uniref:hypothetical protein n=1 Tax=Streptomyces scopuliridis TaxID=452529 RepID=UPI0036A20DD8